MNGFLDQLSTRSLEYTPLAVRPRALSRFEADSASEDDVAREAIAETPTENREQAPLRQPRSEFDPIRTHSIVADPVVSPTDESGPADLSRRLDRLDQRISSITSPETAAQPIAPLPPVEPAVTSIHRSESHFHEQHHTQQILPTQLIEKSTERIITESPSADSVRPVSHVPPNTVAPRQKEDANTTPPHVSFIERQIERVPRETTPQTLIQQYLQTPTTSSRDKGLATPRVPQIAVEKQAAESASHTVTVTIGRIEVRPPKQETAALPKPQRTNPRIMSLTDYVRRRAGGAS